MTNVAFPETTLGLRARWLIDQVSGAADQATDAEAADEVGGDDPQGLLNWLRREAAGLVVDRLQVEGDALLVYGSCSRGRHHELLVTMEDDARQRIGWVRHRRALPQGMGVRRAEERDNDAIVDVCRSTPLALGDTKVTIDPGSDYFAYMRLMENRMPLVATDDDRPVAVHCAVVYPAMLAGENVRLAQILHSRVSPAYTGLGLWSVMNRMVQELGRESYGEWDDTPRDGSVKPEPVVGCAYMAVDNASVHRLSGAQATWSCRPYRLTLPCAALGARDDRPDSGTGARRATAADAGALVQLFNAAHEGEELFRPYSVATLTKRLERAPDLYTWDDILMTGRAAVGVWHAGSRRTIEHAGGVDDSIRSLVLDYGFVPGGEDDLERLLRMAGSDANNRAHTHLSVFTSDPSRGSERLRSLSDATELYEFTTPGVSEPESAPERGVYVDQIYF